MASPILLRSHPSIPLERASCAFAMAMHFRLQDPVPCWGCEPTASDPRGSVLAWLGHAVVASLSPLPNPSPPEPQSPLSLYFLVILPTSNVLLGSL